MIFDMLFSRDYANPIPNELEKAGRV